MIRWREGVVTGVRRSWGRAMELDCEVDDSSVRALAYIDLVGSPEPGDRVLLNATALLMGLGTGGYAMVVALPDRLPADPPAAPGHLVKARYTPMQTTVLGVDEQDAPTHAVLLEAASLHGMPVVVADLHSALPAIIAGAWTVDPELAIAYVMTDGGALALDFSMSVDGLRQAGWLASTITVGQAFGGDHEAVSLHSGLLAAKHVAGADLVVVTQGPGNLGTGTPWGFSGLAAGEAINAAGVLDGRPVASLRVSEADQRERHHGISHHNLTAYGRVALVPADVPVPLLPGDFGALVRTQARVLSQRHRLIEIEVDGLMEALRASPVRLSTMGRGLDQDAAAFIAASAAGRHAARLLALRG